MEIESSPIRLFNFINKIPILISVNLFMDSDIGVGPEKWPPGAIGHGSGFFAINNELAHRR
jgi:hypothetical protein